MKCTAILLLFLTFSQISLNICTSLMRKPTKRTVNKRNNANPKKNKWYQFLNGIIFGGSGKDLNIKKLDKCIPKGWTSINIKPALNDIAQAQEKSSFLKLVNGVQKFVKIVEKFKDKFIELFSKKVRKILRRSKYKILIQTSLSIKWNFNKMKQLGGEIDQQAKNFEQGVQKSANKLENESKNAINKVENQTKKAINDVKQAKTKLMKEAKNAINVANKSWSKVKYLAKDVGNSVKIFITHTVAKVKVFFKKEIFEKIKLFFLCAKEVKDLSNELIKVINNMIARLTLIASIAEQNFTVIAKMVIELICNFSLFRSAFTFLVDSLNENDVLKKYILVGKFFGIGFAAFVL